MIKRHVSTIMLGAVCMFWAQLCGVTCDVINQVQEAALSKRLWIICKLEKHDALLLKENIAFSSNNPAITISAVRFATQPEQVFVPAFNQHKKAFKRSVNCALDIACDGDAQKINELLEATTFFIEGMVVRRKGQVRPFTQKITCKSPLAFAQSQWDRTFVLTANKQPSELTPMAVTWLKPPTVFNDFIEWQRLIRVLGMLHTYFRHLLEGFFNWVGFVVLFAIMVLSMLKKRFAVLGHIWRFNAGHTRDIQVLSLFLIINGLLMRLHGYLRADVYCGITALIFLGGMVYAFTAPARLVNFFEKAKVLLGLIFGSLVPPLLLKLVLFHYGF